MKRILLIPIGILLTCIFSYSAAKNESGSICDVFDLLKTHINGNYKLDVWCNENFYGYANMIPYNTNKQRNGTKFSYHIRKESSNLELLINYKNDTLTDVIAFNYDDRSKSYKSLAYKISDIKVCTDFPYDRYLRYGDTTAIVYQGYFTGYDERGNIKEEFWEIFLEDDFQIDDNRVGIGYSLFPKDTVDYTKERCLLFKEWKEEALRRKAQSVD